MSESHAKGYTTNLVMEMHDTQVGESKRTGAHFVLDNLNYEAPVTWSDEKMGNIKNIVENEFFGETEADVDADVYVRNVESEVFRFDYIVGFVEWYITIIPFKNL